MNDNQLNQIWKSNFGNEYTKRKMQTHHQEELLRENFWKDLPNNFKFKSVLEIGCNAGLNLNALAKHHPNLKISAIEPNSYAFEVISQTSNGSYGLYNCSVAEMPIDLRADLVFACTVLIHVHPDNLNHVLDKMFDASDKYILIMEYYWPCEKEIIYRGLSDALWKRDYGAIFLNRYDVKIVETGYLDHRDGFDRVTWWLFEKK
jgi:pseudaminic acid biosynthesis-associated methylase